MFKIPIPLEDPLKTIEMKHNSEFRKLKERHWQTVCQSDMGSQRGRNYTGSTTESYNFHSA